MQNKKMKPTNKQRNTYKLGDLIGVKHGFAFKGKYFSNAGSHVVLTPGNFFDKGGFRRRTEKDKWYTGPVDQKYVLNKGDVIVAMTEQGEGLLGSTAIVPEVNIFLHNQRIGLVEVHDNENVSLPYFYYLLNSREVRSLVVATSTGTKVRHTSPERICDINVEIPSKNEQEKIAKILDAYGAKIENNNTIIKTLEEMAQAIFKQWFVHYRFPGHENTEFVDSEMGRIPKGWEIRELGSLGKVITGKTPSTADDGNFGVEYPFITIPDLQNGIFVLNTERLLSQQGADTMRNSDLPEGAVCVSCIATVGLLGLTTKKSYTNQQINSIVPHSPTMKYYLLLLLQKMKGFLNAYGSGGTATPIISKSAFEHIPLITPPESLLNSFYEQVNPMFATVRTVLSENQKLVSLRDLLLPRLMSDEIEV